VSITYLHNKKSTTKTVTLKNSQGNTQVVKAADFDLLGGTYREVTEATKQELGISYGLEVMKVSDGALKDAGISKGFIILKADDEPIKSIEQLQKAVKTASTSRGPVLYIKGIYPTGKRAYYAVELAK
jgi:S1-C subfamily serine protease